MLDIRHTFLILTITLIGGCKRPGGADATSSSRPPAPTRAAAKACFLLYRLGVGEVRRAPASACRERVTPASTFKIPHALAALDAGVIPGPDAVLAYDGSPMPFATWKRDHTLASAMRYSVVWYFQRIAERLGPARERTYLEKLNYGNADSSAELTSFWLGKSLLISPEEQQNFLVRLYQDSLPISRPAMRSVREMLVQPSGTVVNAGGEHVFGAPWPRDTVLSAKTGSSDDISGNAVQWIIGQVARGDHSWIFVSCVIDSGHPPPLAAINLAALSLHEEGVL